MKKIFAILFLLIVAVSCDDFGDINKNPNASEVPLTSALLTTSMQALGATVTGANLIAGYYCQYFSQTLYTSNSLYAAQDWDWSAEMSGSMMDLQNIIEINSNPATAGTAALQGSNNNQIAIARILKAYRFSVLTDRYGDMPYFQALKNNTQPTFDSQEDIYIDLFKELSEAVDQIDDAGNVKGDIIYGDTTHWKKFANSLRLVLALRVSGIDEDFGIEQFNAALNADGGVFTSNADNAVLAYPGGGFQNPFFGLGGDQVVSGTVANKLNSTNDLRRNAYGNPSGGTLIGFPYGLDRDAAIAWATANPGPSLILNNTFRAQDSNFFVLTYAQVLLARAQAEYYGWTTGGDYVQMYTDGLRASWLQWGVYDAAAFITFIEGNNVALAGGSNPADEAKIGEQRWLTFFPNGAQGWSEWRRTGFPVLTPTPDAVNTSKEIPRRFPFPSPEYTYNRANINVAVERMGGDSDIDHIWWDN